MFDALSDLDDDSSTTSTTPHAVTPVTPNAAKISPPIPMFYINYMELKKSITKLTGVTTDMAFKILLNNLVVRPPNLDQYVKVTEYLKTNGIQYYSYNPSPVKPKRS